MHYTLEQSLQLLKDEIIYYEKKKKETNSEMRKRQLQNLIISNIERGLKLIEYTKNPCPHLLDWFLDRTEGGRPSQQNLINLESVEDEKKEEK